MVDLDLEIGKHALQDNPKFQPSPTPTPKKTNPGSDTPNQDRNGEHGLRKGERGGAVRDTRIGRGVPPTVSTQTCSKLPSKLTMLSLKRKIVDLSVQSYTLKAALRSRYFQSILHGRGVPPTFSHTTIRQFLQGQFAHKSINLI